MRINNYNSLYKIDRKPEPFIDTGAYTAYKNIPLGIKGVYVFTDFITGKPLYVGKAKDLRKRLYSYTALEYGTAQLLPIVGRSLYSYTALGYGTAFKKLQEIEKKHESIGVLAFKSEKNFLIVTPCDNWGLPAFILEDFFIKTFNPPFNVRREL